MASFTDSPELLTRFNPYVQQAPTEALVSVGTELQRRYDEGVQKIQSSIDRVAGLDIARDVDKKYLQSKLNDLGTRLRTVAAGDFSNYQLTNHVAGMASSVGKDENIITAVKSTAWYRKQAELMQKDAEEGKSNPANDTWFNKRANTWFNSEKPGEAFNTSYFTPRDVFGKIKDIAKEVGIDEKDIMQLYQTNEQGKILRDEKGNAKWNPVMAEQILKGKDPAKILSAFQNSLTSADFQQLSIEGEYQLAAKSPQELKDDLTLQTTRQSREIDEKVTALKSQLSIENQKGKERDEDRIKSLNDQITYFETQTKRLQRSLEVGLSAVDTNPDVVRGSLYTNNYLNEMSNNLSGQETSIKYSVSPMWTISKDQANLDIANKKLQMDEEHFRLNYLLSEKKYDLDKLIAEGKIGPGSGTEGIPLGLNDVERKMTAYRIESNYSNKIAEKNEYAKQLTINYYKRSNEKQKEGESSEAYERRIGEIIDKAKGNNKLEDWYNKIASQEASSASSNAINDRGLIRDYQNAFRDAEVMRTEIESVRASAVTRAEAEGIKVPLDSDIIKGINNTKIKIEGENGIESINLTPQDVLDFIYANPISMGKDVLGFRNPFTGKEYTQRAKESQDKLIQKFGKKYKDISNSLLSGGSVGLTLGFAMNPEAQKIVDKMNITGYRRLKELESDIYIERGTLQQGMAYPVLQGKEKEADRNAKVDLVIKKYAGEVKVEDISKAALSSNNAIRVMAIPNADGTARYTLTIDVGGEDTKPVEITRDEFKYLSGQNPPTSMVKPSEIIMLESKHTTNLAGNNSGSSEAGTTAFFRSSEFTNFNDPDYTIKGDLVDIDGTNNCYMQIYVYNKKGEYLRTVNYPDPSDPQFDILCFPKYMADRSYNTALQYTPTGINSAVLRYLIGDKNGQ